MDWWNLNFYNSFWFVVCMSYVIKKQIIDFIKCTRIILHIKCHNYICYAAHKQRQYPIDVYAFVVSNISWPKKQ